MTNILWTTTELPAHDPEPEPDDGDDGPWCPTPNWRDQPDELQSLCQLGARQLHGEWGVERDTDTVTVKGELL